jgi:hypothetical protein
LVIFLGLLAVVIAGVQAYQRHQNKLAFQQARTAIDEVYKDIVTKVGPPAASKKMNECSRPNQEFTQGPLSCAIGTSFIYPVANHGDATKKYKAIQDVIKSRPDLFKPEGKLSSEIKDELVVNTYYHSTIDKYRSNKDLKCYSSYIFDTPREMDLSINSNHALQINLDCSDSAKTQLYPLHKG